MYLPLDSIAPCLAQIFNTANFYLSVNVTQYNTMLMSCHVSLTCGVLYARNESNVTSYLEPVSGPWCWQILAWLDRRITHNHSNTMSLTEASRPQCRHLWSQKGPLAAVLKLLQPSAIVWSAEVGSWLWAAVSAYRTREAMLKPQAAAVMPVARQKDLRGENSVRCDVFCFLFLWSATPRAAWCGCSFRIALCFSAQSTDYCGVFPTSSNYIAII